MNNVPYTEVSSRPKLADTAILTSINNRNQQIKEAAQKRMKRRLFERSKEGLARFFRAIGTGTLP